MSWLTTMGIVRAGTILLLGIALIYVTAGYPYLSNGLLRIDPALSGEVKAIWLAFSFHLLLSAALLFMYSHRKNLQKTLLWLCGSVLFVDGLLVRGFVSSFYLPAQFLMIAGLMILMGSFCITWEGIVLKRTQLTTV